MKKNGIFKRIGITALLALVSIALILTCFTFTMPARSPVAEAVTPVEVFDDISVVDKVDYGDSFTVKEVPGTTVKVIAPNGDDVTGTAAAGVYTVVASQVGNYVVTYTKGAITYDFKVFVTLDEEYFLKVDFDGADIPTYIKTGDKFKVPAAHVAYYDDNNVLHYYPAEDVVITIKDSDHPDKNYAAGDDFEAYKNGKIYLTYSAEMGANGKKFFNKTFTINSQSTLSEASNPTLSVSGVTSDISVNRPVTLPKATATDSYDENVKIEITVKDPDKNKVRVTDIDRYGYAYQESGKEYAEVVFDNDKAMTFYPTMLGDYVVTYEATNDAGKTASVREYYMTCKDLAAPVFESIDDFRIPETWGLEVKKADSSGNPVVVDELGGKISFPIPEVVDNKDRAYPREEGDTDLISLYFRITDSDNSRTIVEFTNILADSESSDCKFTSNATYGEKDSEGNYEVYTFNKDTNNGLFTFDFNLYNKTDSKGEKADLPGTYTVYYRARDKAQNTSSRTFTITLEDEYEDVAAPSAAEVNAPAYISATDKELTIPVASVADAKDIRPEVVYRVYSNNALEDVEGGRFITVKGGEKAELITEADKLYLVIDKDKSDYIGTYAKKLELGDKLFFYVSATDKVGNVKRNTSDNSDDYTKCDATVEIIGASAAKAYAYTGNIEFVKDGGTTITAGDTVKAGEFKITTTKAMRQYTGFEVAVLDPQGNALTATLETFSKLDGNDVTIYVKNITFKTAVDGDHTMYVRVFDVNGRNTVNGYTFSVAASAQGGTTTTATVIGTSGSVNVKYKLHNETMNGIGDDPNATYFVARRITGGVFSLMGSEFTAKSQGSYSVKDGYVKYDPADADFASYDYDTDFNAYGGNDGKYSFSVTDTAAPVIEVQGVMPTYQAKGETVTLPSVIAYTENGSASVEVKVTNKSGNEVTTTAIEGNKYTFVGKTDGAYTVTYTATYKKATPVTASFTINIGDVEGPEFTISGGTSGRMVVGDVFTFGTMEISLAEGESTTGVTITKKLIDPSKEEVSSATVSGSYNTYKDYTDNGTEITFGMAGQYEVVYTATDAVGNVTTQRFNITVVSSGSGTPTTITTLSTVLIIVAVVLLAGVIIYVVRFRKVKEKKK